MFTVGKKMIFMKYLKWKFIDYLLNFTIRVFAWCLAIDHEIYKKYEKSVKNITLSNLLKEIAQYQICKGIHNEKVFQSAEQHVVPKKFDLLSNTSKTCETKFYRCPACLVLSATYFCTNFIKYENQKSSQLKKVIKKKEANNLIPAKPKAPLSKTSTQRIKLTFQNYRLENKSLKKIFLNYKKKFHYHRLQFPQN